jgi:hypothetical protein
MIAENKDIRTTNSISEIVDCVGKSIYGDAPLELLSFYSDLPNNQLNNYLRVLSVPYLFHAFEENINSNQNAIEWFAKTLLKLKGAMRDLHKSESFTHIMTASFELQIDERFENEVKSHTGQHYGNLFKDFDHKSYFNEAKNASSPTYFLNM